MKIIKKFYLYWHVNPYLSFKDEELCFCIGDVEQSVRRQEGDGADFDFKDIPFQVNCGTCRIPFDIQWFEE